MHNTTLQRVKSFLNVKMINLEKIKQEKCQLPPPPPPPPPPPIKRAPPPPPPPPFLIFRTPPPREVIKIYFPPPHFRKMGVQTMPDVTQQSCILGRGFLNPLFYEDSPSKLTHFSNFVPSSHLFVALFLLLNVSLCHMMILCT